MTPEERVGLKTARPVDPEAYEAYLKAMFHLYRKTPEGSPGDSASVPHLPPTSSGVVRLSALAHRQRTNTDQSHGTGIRRHQRGHVQQPSRLVLPRVSAPNRDRLE